jgi:uncharacterized protein YdaU (DUF1376 family)
MAGSVNGYPYFKWYPADAETDDFYSSLTDEELGVYHRLLNRSWINDGIPSNPEEIRSLLRRRPDSFRKIWEKISKKWITSPRDTSKLVNQRQEEERRKAVEISENNKRPGNTNASRTRLKREPNGTRMEREKTPRAYDCASESSSPEKNKPEVVLSQSESSPKFDEWWKIWAASRGTNHKQNACQAWVSVVTVSLADACFECTRSYLASRKPADGGYNPENFLFDQAREGFQARWPAIPGKEPPKLNIYNPPPGELEYWRDLDAKLPGPNFAANLKKA